MHSPLLDHAAAVLPIHDRNSRVIIPCDPELGLLPRTESVEVLYEGNPVAGVGMQDRQFAGASAGVLLLQGRDFGVRGYLSAPAGATTYQVELGGCVAGVGVFAL